MAIKLIGKGNAGCRGQDAEGYVFRNHSEQNLALFARKISKTFFASADVNHRKESKFIAINNQLE